MREVRICSSSVRSCASRGLQRVRRAIGVHLARRAGGQQLARALRFLPRVGDVDLALRAHRLEAGDLSLLHARVDLHQHRAGGHAVVPASR